MGKRVFECGLAILILAGWNGLCRAQAPYFPDYSFTVTNGVLFLQDIQNVVTNRDGQYCIPESDNGTAANGLYQRQGTNLVYDPNFSTGAAPDDSVLLNSGTTYAGLTGRLLTNGAFPIKLGVFRFEQSTAYWTTGTITIVSVPAPPPVQTNQSPATNNVTIISTGLVDYVKITTPVRTKVSVDLSFLGNISFVNGKARGLKVKKNKLVGKPRKTGIWPLYLFISDTKNYRLLLVEVVEKTP